MLMMEWAAPGQLATRSRDVGSRRRCCQSCQRVDDQERGSGLTPGLANYRNLFTRTGSP